VARHVGPGGLTKLPGPFSSIIIIIIIIVITAENIRVYDFCAAPHFYDG